MMQAQKNDPTYAMAPENDSFHYEPSFYDLSFSHKQTRYDASYAYHRHDTCEIYLFLSGNIRFYVEHSCFVPSPGSLFILNPHEMHRIQTMDDSVYDRIVINLKKEYMEQLSRPGFSLSSCFFARPLGMYNLRTLNEAELAEFLELFRNMSDASFPDCYGKSTKRDAYASLLLLFVNHCYESHTGHAKNTMPAYITKAMQYIEEHLSEPIHLSFLSELTHISTGHLSTQFKSHTGLTLRSFLLDRKITRAKELLLQGADVTEACFQSGFHDYANFIRSFKKATGISPGKFRTPL